MLKLILLVSILSVSQATQILWGQCAGDGYTGDKVCASGSRCVFLNSWYSQCQPSTDTTIAKTTTPATTAKLPIGNQIIWGQCGGDGYTGATNCASGSTCVFVNVWYSQCQPSSASTASTQTSSSTARPQTASTTTQAGQVTTSGSSTLNAVFPGCQFRNGRNYDQPGTDYSQYDYVSIWINTPASDGSGTNFNPYYQGDMIKATKKAGKIPLFYGYIIAFEARYRKNLQDCDMSGSNNLCTDGANFIRDNRAFLVSRYAHQANAIATAMGDKNAVTIWVMEPDFWQYYGDKSQNGGTLSGDYMRALLDDFVKAIKTELPNAIISWDISAWIGVDGFTQWWSYFKSASYINFIHTSGGQSHGESADIKPNELKWMDVHKITGKNIIADCGYGVGGAASNNCGPWFTSSINDRINDGVVSLSMANPNTALTNKPKLC